MTKPEIHLEKGASRKTYWREIWRYRELLVFLAWRDVLVRYKQTVAGIGWAVLRPAITVLVFTILFGRLGKLPSDGVPYPVLVLAAMPAWQMFSTAISAASLSLVSNTSLISKVYFPRLVIPCASVGATLMDLLITLVLCSGAMWFYGVTPAWSWLLAIPLSFVVFLAALGPTVLLAALSVHYRDFKHLTPFIVQIGTYVTPVGFTSSLVPEQWRLLFACNPMVGVIEAFRWAFYGSSVHLPSLGISGLSIVVFLVAGIVCFRKMERGFADVI